MHYRFFMIPVANPEAEAAALNSFLSQHKVLSVKESFVAEGQNSFWAFSVSYLTGQVESSGKQKSLDYREVLSETDFQIYSRLRELRKTLATEQGLPPYLIFTNEQLASMVTARVTSKTQLAELDGIGESKVSKYGEAFLRVLTSAFKEAL